LTKPKPTTNGEPDTEVDEMLLDQDSGSLIAKEFGLDEMAVEIERAVEQVEKKIAGGGDRTSSKEAEHNKLLEGEKTIEGEQKTATNDLEKKKL
jgi:hypothetical protein